MTRTRGTITLGDEVILRDIELFVETINPRSGLKSWHGSFFLPEGDHIEQGNYGLVLEDGRSGNIIVRNVVLGSDRPTSVRFDGSGPLTRGTKNPNGL